jgi:arabinofuranan 3-O-arabinosyltransferase
MIDTPQQEAAGGHGPVLRQNWWTSGPAGRDPDAGGALDERLRRSLWLVACCLLLAALAFVTRPGNIIADTKIDLAIDPLGFLRRALQLWDPAQLGQLQNQAVGYFFPMGPFFVLGKLAALPAWVVQRLWLTAVFVAAFLGTVRLSYRLGIGSPASRIAAGFAYALAPRGLSLMGINSSEFLPAAMLPLILIPLVRLLRHGQEMSRRQKLRAAAQSGVAVALCGGINAAAVVGVLTVAVVYVLTGQRNWQRWRALAWWAPAIAVATWWWTVPLLLLGRFGVSILPYSESAAVTTSVTSLSDILRGTGDWTTYLVVNGMPWWPTGFHISTGALPTVLTGLVAVLGLAGMLSRRVPERRFLLWALLVGIVVISSGYVSGLGNPLAGVIDHVINGPLAPLRNIRKFDPLIRLPMALGLAQLLGSVRFARVRAAVAIVAATGLAGLAIPAAMTGLSADGDFPAIPSYWVSATNWLNAHATHQAVLAVPGANFGEYIWGRPMDDVLEAMFAGDWASTQLAVVGSPGSTRILEAVEQRVEAGEGSAGLTQLLAEMGVKYIVVRNDLLRSDLYGAWPARVLDALYSSPGLVKVAQFGTFPVGGTVPDDAVASFDTPVPPVEIFRVSSAQPVASVVPAAAAIRVYGGPESVLNLADSGVLKNHPVLLNSDSPDLRARQYVVTDSLRRIVRNFGEIRIDYSQTLSARDPATTIDAADDYLEQSWLPDEAVAQYHGIANVTASSSGSDMSALPGQSATGLNPFSAVDGNLNTMWESASLTGPVHQWLQVDFEHPVSPGVIHVAFADSTSVGPPITQVDVQTAAGTMRESVRQTASSQPLTVPPGASRWLRIKVESVGAWAYPLAGTQAGIAEIAVPGIRATRTIDAPAVTIPGGAEPSVLLAKAEPQPSGCMLTTLRWVCSPSLIKPTEEQYGFDQEFTMARSFPARLSGLAVMTSARLIASHAYLGQQPTVTASSVYTTGPEDAPDSALDGNLTTSWISGATDANPVLKIRWHGARTLSGITVVRPPGAAGPLQVLVTGSGGRLRGGIIGASGKLRFAPALRTNRLTLAFKPSQLPLQISEVQIPGVQSLATFGTAPVNLRCGNGPTITVNGEVVRTRATGTVTDLLEGRPLAFAACSDVAVRTGHNDVVELAADPRGFDVQSVLVDPTGPAGLRADATTPVAPVATVTWSDSARLLRVAASQRSFLIVRQNFNAGWQASLGDRILAPVQLNGWEQAWLLPAGTHGLVKLTYVPDAVYRDALFGGLGSLALVFIVALVPLRRRKRRPPAAAERGPAAGELKPAGLARSSGWGRSGAVLVKVLGGSGVLAGAGLWLGGRPGALLLPATTFLFVIAKKYQQAGRFWGWLATQWLVPALMLAVAVSGAAGLLLQDRGASGALVSGLWDLGPQLACLVIVARLAAELGTGANAGRGPAGHDRAAAQAAQRGSS